MSYKFVIVALLTSWSSMAWIDLQLTSGDYRITARLNGDNGGVTRGTVEAQTLEQGTCQGRFIMDPAVGVITVDFDGLNGPDSDGNCANESMVVHFGPTGFTRLMSGEEIDGEMISVMFFKMPRPARVKITGQGQ